MEGNARLLFLTWRRSWRHGRQCPELGCWTLLKLNEVKNSLILMGLLQKFLKWHDYSLWQRTTLALRLPQDLITKVLSFIVSTRKLCHSKNYPLSSITNMNEMPLWLDIPGDTTITRRREQSIPLHTTGHEKGRFTVVLSVMAYGRKLKPCVVFKGVRAIPDKNTPGVLVALSKNGYWMRRWWRTGWSECEAVSTLSTSCLCGMLTSATSQLMSGVVSTSKLKLISFQEASLGTSSQLM